MKSRKLLALILVLVVAFAVCLVACTETDTDEPVVNEYQVTFVFGDGYDIFVVEDIFEGSKIAPPEEVPTRVGYAISGWYATEDFSGEKWNFESDTLTGNLTLYAKWEEAEISIAQALAIANALQDGEKTEGRYLIRGKVASIDNPTYGQMTLTDGTNSISVYGTYSADGSKRYSDLSEEEKPFKDDEVLLYAVLQNFKGNGEVYSGWILEFVRGQAEGYNPDDYKAVTVNEARTAERGSLLQVTGVVACITYANGMKPSGFYLIDNTNSVYVYDSNVAPRVSVGNTVTVNGEKTYWILETEQGNADKFGYKGCCQLQNAHLEENDGKVSDFDTSWIPESTVKEVMDTPVTEDISTTVFKVNALIKKAENTGFTNYYIDDLDGRTGSYVYTQCNGKDFAWMDEFDGKICTVYLSAINAKSTASGCTWRFIPVAVSDDNFLFDLNDAGKYAVIYHGLEQFQPEYSADPELEVLTSVSSDLLEFEGATLTYSSDNEAVVYFDGNVMHVGEAGVAHITVTGKYLEYQSYSETVTVTVTASEKIDALVVAEAIASEVDTEVTAIGIVGPSLVNQIGFYLIDDTGVIAIRMKNKDDMKKFSVGNEIVVKGTRAQFKSTDTLPGQTCLLDSELVANNFGSHEYSTATFIEGKTIKDLYELDATENHTTDVYVVEAKIILTNNERTVKAQGEDGTELTLYCSGKGQYAWILDEYAGQTLTMEIATVNWNNKSWYAGCVLAIYLPDGTKIVNELNFNS